MVTELFTDWQLDPIKRRSLLTKEITRFPHVMAGVQAHLHNNRFPGKIYADIKGAPMLFHVLNKVSLVSAISTTCIITTDILDYVPEGVAVHVSSKPKAKDVLLEYYTAAEHFKPDYIVRVTSDCPALDPFLMEYVVQKAVEHKADYCSNVLKPTFPDGQDIEVMSANLLKFMYDVVRDRGGREHVTMAFRKNTQWQETFKTVSVINQTDYSKIKMSVDTVEDLKEIELYV